MSAATDTRPRWREKQTDRARRSSPPVAASNAIPRPICTVGTNCSGPVTSTRPTTPVRRAGNRVLDARLLQQLYRLPNLSELVLDGPE
jgi:hypothetical protein